MDNHQYQELIYRLGISTTVDDLHEITSQFCSLNGFDHFHYGTRIPTSFTKPYFIHISGYPSDWWTHYNDNNYLKDDPTVEFCASNFLPLTWDKVDPKKDFNKPSSKVMLRAKDFGLSSGISFPAHTPQGDFAMCSFASSLEHKIITDNLNTVSPLGLNFTFFLHEAVRRVFSTDPVPLRPIDLTQREKETLLWTAEGKTTWEISQILSIAERTVVFHIQNVTQKLNVANRQQAVARAVSLGLIKPQM